MLSSFQISQWEDMRVRKGTHQHTSAEEFSKLWIHTFLVDLHNIILYEDPQSWKWIGYQGIAKLHFSKMFYFSRLLKVSKVFLSDKNKEKKNLKIKAYAFLLNSKIYIVFTELMSKDRRLQSHVEPPYQICLNLLS